MSGSKQVLSRINCRGETGKTPRRVIKEQNQQEVVGERRRQRQTGWFWSPVAITSKLWIERRFHSSPSLDLAKVPLAAELTVPWGRRECRQEHQPGSDGKNLGVGWGDIEDLKFGTFFFKEEQKLIGGGRVFWFPSRSYCPQNTAKNIADSSGNLSPHVYDRLPGF